MNAAVMLAYNQTKEQLDLTKLAVKSAMEQDIPVELFLIDNGSTDGGFDGESTFEWMRSIESDTVHVHRNEENISPVKVSNDVMFSMFAANRECVFGFPNDVILPSNIYREMLSWPRGIVTASMSGDVDFKRYETSKALNTCTPMAVTLIRKWCYDAVMSKDGYFYDPGFFNYASDCDFALRLAACGITGIQLDIEYYHYGSGSWRLLPHDKGKLITNQADIDRDYFRRKWGFNVSDPQYGQRAADINFKGEPNAS